MRVEALVHDLSFDLQKLNEKMESNRALDAPSLQEMIQWCQRALPIMDDYFRTYMLYGDAAERTQTQVIYNNQRQLILALMAHAQMKLAEPSPTP
jgi:hypothetical protein